MIAIYNTNLNDVLMLITGDNQGEKLTATRKDNVAKVMREDNGQVVAWNFFDASTLFPITGNGQVDLSDADVDALNGAIEAAGFEDVLVSDHAPKFVVGEIVDLIPHPDSDHLNIAQVKVAEDKTIQIVAGAPNARVGLKTIVALPGAMMPSGALIFAGQLRSEPSFGMMASPRELALANAPQKRGIIELGANEIPGTAFEPTKHWQK
ncbi:DUF4479 and tRNA-binding domain-containing protein [Pseudolactococcus yaeyamensis]